MWPQRENQTASLRLYEKNSSQAVLEAIPQTTNNAKQNIGTTISPWSSHSDRGLEQGSGIVPGMSAAALFIGFVLALYAVLWKCMVSPPRRKRKKKKVAVVVRHERMLRC